MDACTVLAEGKSVETLPGDDEQIQLLDGSVQAPARPTRLTDLHFVTSLHSSNENQSRERTKHWPCRS